MSIRKQRIAKRLEVLGLAFNGQKIGGKYTIGSATFKTLDEIEAYIESLEQANEQQSVVETVKTETWEDRNRDAALQYQLEQANEQQSVVETVKTVETWEDRNRDAALQYQLEQGMSKSNRKPFNDRAGYVASKKNPITGISNVIYVASEQGIESDSKYVTVCEGHKQMISSTSIPKARIDMKDASQWCSECQGLSLLKVS